MSISLWYPALLLVAALVGWFLASKRAVTLGAVVASDFERTRSDFEAKLNELRQLLVAREAELTTSRGLLDELRIKAAVASEQHVRVETLRESDRSLAAARDEEIDSLKARVAEIEGVRDAHRTAIASLEVDNARLNTVIEQERKAHEQRMHAYLEAEDHFKAAVKATASDALSANNEAFMTLAQARLGNLQHLASADFEQKQKAIQDVIGPVSALLQKLQGDVQLAEQNRVETRTAIIAQVQQVATLVPALQKETSQLSRALKHSGTRGRWGELQLRRTLESAGLVEGEHYSWQQGIDTEGGRLIPDVIIHLPGGGNVVIDAKTPMQAFLDACATDDDEVRAALLGQHAAATRQHVVQLSAKAYGIAVVPSPDFVVMYVPVESALHEVLSSDFTIVEDAAKRDVMLAGPLVLIPLLRAIAFGWKQHQVAERAEEIAEVGALLYDRIATVVEHFVSVGRGLDRTVEAYNSSVASFEGRLTPSARELKALHVKTTKVLKPLAPVDHRTRVLTIAEAPLARTNGQEAVVTPGLEVGEAQAASDSTDAVDGRTH